MKIFLHQACFMGGIYFIVSTILSYIPNTYAAWLGRICLLALIAFLIMLIARRKVFSLNEFMIKYKKISNYVTAFGIVLYFGFFFGFIPGAIDGYLAARASLLQKIYVSQFVTYLPIFAILYWVVFWVGVLLATYFSFVKPWIYKTGNK